MLMYCFRIIELRNKNMIQFIIDSRYANQHYINIAHMCFLFQTIFTTNFKIKVLDLTLMHRNTRHLF